MYCNLSATPLRLNKKQLQPMQPLCDQKLHFSVADQLATGRRQLSLKIGDQSAIDRRLVDDWLPMGLIENGLRLHGRLHVGDGLATDNRSNNLLCRCNHTLNKVLINCYSMVISISIMSYCVFLDYFLVRIHRLRPHISTETVYD